MKEMGRIPKWALGLTLLAALGVVLTGLVGKGNPVGLAARPPATKQPAPTPALTWENATLDQIHFGEPQVVLTDTHSLRIVKWVSNEELLILRDLTQGRTKEAIEVFDVATGESTRLAEGSGLSFGRPVWLPAQKAVAYLAYNFKTEQRDLLISASLDNVETERPRVLYRGATLPLLAGADRRSAMALSVDRQALLRVANTQQKAQIVSLDFSPFIAPSPTPRDWIYGTAQSTQHPWAAVYNIDHFLLVNTRSGEIREVSVVDDEIAREYAPHWVLHAQWSSNGDQLAMIVTAGRLPNEFRRLFIYNLQIGIWSEIDLPSGFGLNNLTWAPDSRLLLLQGAIDYRDGYGIDGHLLVNVSTGQKREVNLIPPDVFGGSSLAWSPGGGTVVFNCSIPGQGYVAMCLSQVEVR